MRLVGLVLATLACAACQGTAPAPTPLAPTPLPPTQTVVLASPSPTSTSAPPAAGTSRVGLLNSADDAFNRGDLGTAGGLYERVLNTPATDENGTAASTINDFAHFRYMVTLLAEGQDSDAQAQLTALQQSDSNATLTRLAAQLFEQYGMVGQLRGACAQLQPQIASQASDTLVTLQALGVAVDPTTLCNVPPG